MDRKGKNWEREELIVAFNLYCRTAFGRIHRGNPEIIQVAKALGRTPSSLAMKMVNFASLDPVHQERSVKGLGHGSKQDKEIWDEFHQDWERLGFESQLAIEKLVGIKEDDVAAKIKAGLQKETEGTRSVRVRLVQRFFREAVLSSYNFSCAVCKIAVPQLLNASHIVPWSADKVRRADPSNGLSLCALHDRAFDRGLMTIDEDLRVVVAGEVKVANAPKLHKVGLLEIEGKRICRAERFEPDDEALAYHRENVFVG